MAKILTNNEACEIASLFEKIEELHREPDAQKREKMIDDVYIHSRRLKDFVNKDMSYDKTGIIAKANAIFGK